MGGYCEWEVDAHGDGIVHGRVLHTGGYSLWGGVLVCSGRCWLIAVGGVTPATPVPFC